MCWRKFLWFPLILQILRNASGAPVADTKCQHKAADIVFLLDSSRSIWEDDFDTQLTFVRNVVDNFHIGHQNIQIGIATFNSVVHLQFYLNKYGGKEELKNAIKNIQYRSGGTNTAEAIKYARQVMFQPEKGGRQYATKIVIVITDGFSSDLIQTAQEASHARLYGITLFAVGVGGGVNEFELRQIGSGEKYLYRVDDYSALETIRDSLSTRACDELVDQPLPIDIQEDSAITEAKENCGGKPADVFFVLDASSSIWEPNFNKQLQFVKDVVDIFDIGPNKTRVGILVYSDGIHPMVTLHNNLTKKELKRRIDYIPYLTGGTNTGNAIQYIRERGFAPGSARPGVAHVAIILTDGQSFDTKHTQEEAISAQRDGIYLFAIGIGEQTDPEELTAIASNPDKDFKFQIDNYEALSSIKTILAIKTCTVNDAEESQIERCQSKGLMDILFVYDATTIGKLNSEEIKMAVAGFMKTLQDDNDNIRVGVVSANCHHHQNGQDARLQDPQEVVKMISKRHIEGLGGLVHKVRRHGFSSENGGRKKAKKIAILFFDGTEDNMNDLVLEARRAHFTNVEIFVVAIGNKDVAREGAKFCSKPDSQHLISLPDYDELFSLKDVLLQNVC